MNNWDYFDSVPEYHPIADADNLYEAYKASRKGSQWKTQVQRFRWNIGTELYRLQQELEDLYRGREEAYKPMPYARFLVSERGKTRAITALSMRDRVVKHVLNDLYLIPHIRPKLIYDNGASMKGKGISFTRKRLLAHLQSFYRETGSNDGYIMTMDFSGYYDNLDHGRVKEIVRKYETDPFALQLVDQAVDSYKVDVSYMTDEEYEAAKTAKFSTVEYRKEHLNENRGMRYLHKSMSIGDQTSQIVAIAFATSIDKLVTIVCGCRYYARYMDDLYIIGRTKEELTGIFARIHQEAKALRLLVNPKKTKIIRLSSTFTFLQFRYKLRDNGHVVIRINPKTLTRMRRKLKKLRCLVENGEARATKVEEMFRSWIGNYWKYMSRKQYIGITALYRSLYGNGLDTWLRSRSMTGGENEKGFSN